jgi:DNA mismatch endonuclease (patch repair protein)
MDTLTTEERSVRMGLVRSKNTGPELMVRQLAHAMGYRYRLHSSKLPGKPDLVFASQRKVILVHGCFWHQHGGCRNSRIPKSRLNYWKPKFARNKQRDRANKAALEDQGWQVLEIWECETRNHKELALRIKKFLRRTKRVQARQRIQAT